MMLVESPVAVDVETYGTKAKEAKDPRVAEFVCAAVAPHGLVTFDRPTINKGARIVVHNIPYDPVVLRHWDAEWDDTKVVAHLAGRADTTLKGMVTKVLGRPALNYDEAEEQGKIPEYNLADAQNTWELLPRLLDDLRPETRQLYEGLEKPLLPLWAKMTMEGSFRLDRDALEEYRTALTEDVEGALTKVERLLPRGRFVDRCSKCGLLRERMVKGQRCGDGKNHAWGEAYDPDLPVNLNSPSQLLAALQSLGVRVPDTNINTLRPLIHKHPALRALAQYRALNKELSTYISPWCRIAERGERLGAIWRPTGAWTGRVSSAGPNLQNVPKELERFYLPPAEGYELLTYDNAQLEVRIAAHISQDPAMIHACKSGDVHGEFQQVFGFPDRRATKVGVFGTMYLGGPAVVLDQARKFGVPMSWKQAEELQGHVHSRLPDYFRWAHSISEERVIPGLFGRVHNIPVGSEGHMGREAVNSPIQGGAGDVTKFQMLALWRAGYWVVRQVHDSVTVAVRHADVEFARVEVPRIMEGAAPELDVPIKVEPA